MTIIAIALAITITIAIRRSIFIVESNWSNTTTAIVSSVTRTRTTSEFIPENVKKNVILQPILLYELGDVTKSNFYSWIFKCLNIGKSNGFWKDLCCSFHFLEKLLWNGNYSPKTVIVFQKCGDFTFLEVKKYC